LEAFLRRAAFNEYSMRVRFTPQNRQPKVDRSIVDFTNACAATTNGAKHYFPQ